MKTTNTTNDSALGRAIAIALLHNLTPQAKTQLAARLRARQANRPTLVTGGAAA